MRILLTTHDSPHNEHLLAFCAQFACHADEPATILTVIERETDRPRANALLKRARQLLAEVPDVQVKVRTGPPAREIIREAEEGAYDLVIVGGRPNHNPLARFLPSSTTVRVVEHAPCPVLVSKGKTGPIQKILLCDSGAESPLADLTPASYRAARPGPSLLTRFTAQLAEMLKGEEEITVLHVMSQMSAGPGVLDEQLQAAVEKLIEEHAPEGDLLVQDIGVLGRPGIHARPKVRHGLVVEEILAEARSGDYDLVVIGAHRGQRWQRILLDDLAHDIVVQLDRPVLIVR